MRQNEKNRHKNRPCKRAFGISPLLYNLDVDEHISNDVNFKYYSPVEFSKNKQIKANPQRDYYSVLYSLISKIGLDRASIFGRLKPTAAILKGPLEEYSGVTETIIKTLTFSTES